MAKETIKIKKYSDIELEAVANAAIIPGSCVEYISTGKVQKCATASGKFAYLVALEDELQGKGIDDAYAAGDQVKIWVAGRGDIANLLLQDEQTVVIGDYIEMFGEGRVRKYTSGVAIGIAVNAVDLSTYPEGSESSAGGAYYNPRIQVQFI